MHLLVTIWKDANEMQISFSGNKSLICVGVTLRHKICMDLSGGVITSIPYCFFFLIVYTSSSGKSSDRLMLCVCKTRLKGADAVAHKFKPLERLKWVKVEQILCLSTYYLTLQGLILLPFELNRKAGVTIDGAGLAYC